MSLNLDILQHNPLIAEQSAEALLQLFKLDGQIISSDPISELRLVQADGKTYFVKCYTRAGKYLRQFVGRSRARAEYENLKLFQSLGIPTPKVIAFGEVRQGVQRHACLITEEVTGVKSLLDLHREQSPYLKSRQWLRDISAQLAEFTRKLHDKRFVHVDLKWRNILVQPETKQLYFIDCPQGHQTLFRFRRGLIKDLACLDKVARYAVSNTQRLRFYKTYFKLDKLNDKHKYLIRKILAFFKGRE